MSVTAHPPRDPSAEAMESNGSRATPPGPARPYITCRQLLDFIYDYLEGSLPTADRAEFERHLGVCPSCVNYLETYRQTTRISRLALRPPGDSTAEQDLPADLPEPLLHSILATLRR